MINVELFSCAGGMAKGFLDAGIKFDMAVDMAADHVESYATNLGHKPIRMDARDLLRMVKLGWRTSIDLFVADPPCTPWSRAGKRQGTSDERDMLEETCELIALLRPRRYLIGNVPGLDDQPNWHIVQRVIGGLERHGYCVADFAALDAANYGVPQRRIRPFWFGHREGPCIRWMPPTHADPEDLHTMPLPLAGVPPLLPWVTCKQALGHLPLSELGRPVKLRKRNQNSKQHGSVKSKPARVVGTSNLSDGNVLVYDQHEIGDGDTKHPANEADQPAMTIKGSDGGGIKRVLKLGPSGKPSGGRRPATMEGGYTPSTLDQPAKTLVRNTHGDGTVLVLNDKHPPAQEDAPAPTIGSRERHQSTVLQVTDPEDGATWDIRVADPARVEAMLANQEPVVVLGSATPAKKKRSKRRPGLPGSVPMGDRVGKADKPGATICANSGRMRQGGGASTTLEWPWDRPSTTVPAQGDGRIPPPGHHDEDFAVLSLPGAVLLSEKAAAILQGFPETWVFHGKTKKVRWGQLGQAMPPPLAYAVAMSVVEQDRRTYEERADRRVAELEREAIERRAINRAPVECWTP